MAIIDWYFDIISPYSYLQCEQLDALAAEHEVRLHAVLFAGLLNHWGHKGPAEIPAKRQFTYRYVTWYARRMGVPLRAPRAHPFNPLPALRLAVAMQGELAAVQAIHRYIWVDGEIPDGGPAWQALCASLGVPDPEATLADTRIKDTLRSNTEAACAAGVFGVPTAIVEGELFWGVDSTPMLVDYLADPAAFLDEEMQRVSHLPAAASRPGGGLGSP